MVLVTSKRFAEYIDIGEPVSMATIFQSQAADELLFVDIDASREGRTELLLDIVRKAAEKIFMPITVGGGVNSIDDFRDLLLAGADKICINTAAVQTPGFITKAAEMFGRQCVVVSIDYKTGNNGRQMVCTHCGTVDTDKDAFEWAIESQKLGAGEILLTSIDRDGSREGLDIKFIRKVCAALNIPIIASGGCGLAQHFVDGYIEGGVDAVSAGTFFCFKDENLMQTRSQIKNAGVPIRLNT